MLYLFQYIFLKFKFQHKETKNINLSSKINKSFEISMFINHIFIILYGDEKSIYDDALT